MPANLSPSSGDDRRSALHSSWISRLHLRPVSDAPSPPRPRLPTAMASDPNENKRSVFNLGKRARTDPVLDLRSSFDIDFVGGKSRVSEGFVAGFGPYQFRAGRESDSKGIGNFAHFRRLGRLGDGKWRKVGSCDVGERNLDCGQAFVHQKRSSDENCGVKLSPFFRVRPFVDLDGRRRINGERWCESRTASLSLSYFRAEKMASGFSYARHVNRISTSRGSAYFNGTYNVAPRTLNNAGHQNPKNYQVKKSLRVNRQEEPFSFWHMGRHERRDTVSSIPPSVSLTWNHSRKRKANDSNFLPWKSIRTGNNE